jgi:peroxiredoxin
MFRELKAEVVAVSYDPVAALKEFRAKREIPFHLVSDEGSTLIDRYDIRNAWDLLHPGVPHPAAYIIDRQGIIRFADVRQNFLWRTKTGTLVDELRKLA